MPPRGPNGDSFFTVGEQYITMVSRMFLWDCSRTAEVSCEASAELWSAHRTSLSPSAILIRVW